MDMGGREGQLLPCGVQDAGERGRVRTVERVAQVTEDDKNLVERVRVLEETLCEVWDNYTDDRTLPPPLMEKVRDLIGIAIPAPEHPDSISEPTLKAALAALLQQYVDLVNCGDCGKWNPETEPVVINARAALKASK